MRTIGIDRALNATHKEVYVLNLSTGDETTLFTVEEPHHISSLSWQP